MSADVAERPQDLIGAVADPRALVRRAPDRRFHIALAVAALLHASLLVSFSGPPKERLGEADGSDEAINVTLVTEADFLSRTTVPENAGAPKPAATAPSPPSALGGTDGSVRAGKTRCSIRENCRRAARRERAGFACAARSSGRQIQERARKARPERGRRQAAPSLPPKPAQQQTAKLDLTPPKPTLDPPMPGGRSAGVSRPPGITRSGADDDFARAVIRALQQTMPQLRETIGRVTVRIILNENGNVKEVQVVRPSPNSNLNQSVMFAARQTSYPLPPFGSNDADRIFLVTYIYN